MELRNTVHIAAQPDRVWDALQDPAQLRAALPMIKMLHQRPDGQIDMQVLVELGYLRRILGAHLWIRKIEPGRVLQMDATLTHRANGKCVVTLDPADGGTQLTYDIESKVNLAGMTLGSFLVNRSARKMAEGFFDRLGKNLTAQG
ncbi:CoxG family protein [Gemmobacter denitrificans]|uniref:SRPBCC domain-containing protein n=1 Tax=Gemmobacter denitrificans TaxID=3123040 RepID=A0ABU8BWL7_9RHOB